jgi:hypothetical protein
MTTKFAQFWTFTAKRAEWAKRISRGPKKFLLAVSMRNKAPTGERRRREIGSVDVTYTSPPFAL